MKRLIQLSHNLKIKSKQDAFQIDCSNLINFYLNMLFALSPSEIQLLKEKNQRLDENEKRLTSQKIKTTKRNFKPEIRTKFSHHDLKHVFWTGIDKNIPHQNFMEKETKIHPEKKNQKNVIKSNTYLRQQNEQNPKQQQINRQNIIYEDLKNIEMTTRNSFLPSIVKSRNLQQIQSKKSPKNSVQNLEISKLRRAISLDFQASLFNKKDQNVPITIKLKSESLKHLKNKIKLQKANQTKNLKGQKQKSQNSQLKGSQNKSDSSPQQCINSSPTNKYQKRFYINNLNLQTPQNQNEVITKRSYVIKLLQKNEKEVLLRPQKRKNSLNNIVERESLNNRISSMNFYQDDNFITRSITFSHPEQLLLKKIIGKTKGQEKEKKSRLKHWQQNKILKQNNNKITLKQHINAWDIQKQQQPHIFALHNNQFQPM